MKADENLKKEILAISHHYQKKAKRTTKRKKELKSKIDEQKAKIKMRYKDGQRDAWIEISNVLNKLANKLEEVK